MIPSHPLLPFQPLRNPSPLRHRLSSFPFYICYHTCPTTSQSVTMSPLPHMKMQRSSIPATRSAEGPIPKACGAHPPLLRSSLVNESTTSSPHTIGRMIQTLIPAVGMSAHRITTLTCHDLRVQPSEVLERPTRTTRPVLTKNIGGAIVTATRNPVGVRRTPRGPDSLPIKSSGRSATVKTSLTGLMKKARLYVMNEKRCRRNA